MDFHLKLQDCQNLQKMHKSSCYAAQKLLKVNIEFQPLTQTAQTKPQLSAETTGQPYLKKFNRFFRLQKREMLRLKAKQRSTHQASIINLRKQFRDNGFKVKTVDKSSKSFPIMSWLTVWCPSRRTKSCACTSTLDFRRSKLKYYTQMLKSQCYKSVISSKNFIFRCFNKQTTALSTVKNGRETKDW